jgi:nucleoside-diphosphate-sugar epimerase
MATSNTFLIFGANGWIGNQVTTYLSEQGIPFIKARARARANDTESIIQELNANPQITHIMSFIGRTHGTYEGQKITTIDYLEKPGKLLDNVNDNLYSPLNLALLCKERGLHFTYLGTGCIFEYDEDHPFGQEVNGFTEQSRPNFFGSGYSVVKGFTDQLMNNQIFEDTILNLRIRMPITDEVNERNFITKITTYQKVCSIPNSMTVLNTMIPVMVRLAQKNICGPVNLTNPGLISHNEILEMYKEIVDPNFTWTNFSVEEQNQVLASKRSNNFLDTKILESLEPNVKNIKESVRDILVQMKGKI